MPLIEEQVSLFPVLFTIAPFHAPGVRPAELSLRGSSRALEYHILINNGLCALFVWLQTPVEQ